ncbi:iron-sulfur cluster biosynthesis family protein [Candidatus Pseudothioglobus singularis]|nr:iron-sulfur cluster biosynthesis family protein [Candidatus Pseudothioglobus singularis]
MKLTITAEAEKALTRLKGSKDSYLLLWYDTDDCGCAVNGVPTVRFVEEIEPSFEKVENDQFETFVDKSQAIFFHPSLTLDFHNNKFRLKSPEGYLNAFISQSSVSQAVQTV